MVLSSFPKEEDKAIFKGLVPKVPNAYNALCPTLNFGVAKYITWSKTSRWGFNTMQMEKGGNNIVSFENYGDVGFGIDSGHQLVPLMCIGICGSPNIGFGSTMACHFALVVGYLDSTLRRGVKETSRASKVW